MNFLSHFYFDRDTEDSHQVIGMVLPDLLKNANKKWSIRPEKHATEYQDQALKNLYRGWQRHISVDKHFHCSEFFIFHTQTMRTAMAPFLETSPARPSFVAHIALELMLDSLLLTEKSLSTSPFYTHLIKADKDVLANFLLINNLSDTVIFFSFLEEFIDARYLNTYSNPKEIVYALHRICMRVWDNPFNETQKLQLTSMLIDYQERLKEDFMQIFNEIEERLAREGDF
ncbi:hypothetical protein ACFSJU_01165 [Paradesertivirga mongoliensis]|uniref:Acyl carrier protein phosphodiesterase n=1 Tax=Paradesertivirga mongoliensis TaxID=2100740 RepID=A0ABW4ZG25_9SPHI|nr:hypothetical protein [Pedobacter mongoliensis]